MFLWRCQLNYCISVNALKRPHMVKTSRIKYIQKLQQLLFLLFSALLLNPQPLTGQSLSKDPMTNDGQVDSPIIHVRGNDEPIENGDTTTKKANNTDFGDHEVFGDIPVNKFVIKNEGNEILQMRDPEPVNLKFTDTFTFKIVSQPDSRIGAGGSSDFKIRFDPDTQKVQTAVVEIRSNDSNRTPYTFRISGRGTPYTSTLTTKKQEDLSIGYQRNSLKAIFHRTVNASRQLSLIAIDGQQVWQDRVGREPQSVIIPTGNLKPGIYLLKSRTFNTVQTKKVIIN